jgi:CRP-like cAMP-binding protein
MTAPLPGAGRVPAMLSQVPFRLREFAAGESLFVQGDPASAIFCVESGVVRLERKTVDGRLLVLHSAHAGDPLAEASMFAGSYHCDAVAAEACRVRVYRSRDVLAAFRRDPAAAEGLLAHLSRQVQGLRSQLELRNVRSASTRLLLYLEARAGRANGPVELGAQLQHVAAEIGLTREALYRAFADLARRRVVARRRNAAGGHVIEIIRAQASA